MIEGNYNFEFRPTTYFENADPIREILSRIKGERRREFAAGLLQKGAVEEIPDFLLKDGLTDGECLAVGSVHPLFMSGEYLPDLGDGEVEIARIVLESVTGDVVSIRARPSNGKIEYRVTDEYEEEAYVDYRCHSAVTDQPLNFGELIEFIDSVERVDGEVVWKGLSNSFRDFLLNSSDPEDVVDFVTIHSDFYPEITAYYEQESQEWLKQKKSEWEDNELDAEPVSFSDRDIHIRRHLTCMLGPTDDLLATSARANHWKELYDYVEQWIHTAGKLPTGDHRIAIDSEPSSELEAWFPDSEIEFAL